MNQWDDELEAAETGWGAPVPLYFDFDDKDGLIISTEVRLCGWSIRETAAAVATINLRNGSSVGAAIGAVLNLAASASETVWLGDRGVRFNAGVFLDRLTGEVEGVLFVRYPLPYGS